MRYSASPLTQSSDVFSQMKYFLKKENQAHQVRILPKMRFKLRQLIFNSNTKILYFFIEVSFPRSESNHPRAHNEIWAGILSH